MRIALSAALVAALLPACSPHSSGPSPAVDSGPHDALDDSVPFVPDECKPAPTNTAEVVVGKGQTFYADITPGETLTWERGPQGGHHVWIAVRTLGLHKQGTIITVKAADVENPAAPVPINGEGMRVVYDLNRDEGGHCTLPGLRLQLDVAGAPPLDSLAGHHLEIKVVMQDGDGTSATGKQTILVTGTM